jgi:hypothetical protein
VKLPNWPWMISVLGSIMSDVMPYLAGTVGSSTKLTQPPAWRRPWSNLRAPIGLRAA